MSPVDVADIDVEYLDIDLVSRTQIIEFISRKEVDLARLVEVILFAQGYRVQAEPFGKHGGVSMVAESGEGPIGFRPPRIAVLVHPGHQRVGTVHGSEWSSTRSLRLMGWLFKGG